MFRIKTTLLTLAKAMTKRIWCTSSMPPLVLHAVQKQNVEALCAWAQNLTLPSSNTTWFNFLASHDGIGLNPLRGLLPENEILALVEVLQQEGALVNWKK